MCAGETNAFNTTNTIATGNVAVYLNVAYAALDATAPGDASVGTCFSFLSVGFRFSSFLFVCVCVRTGECVCVEMMDVC